VKPLGLKNRRLALGLLLAGMVLALWLTASFAVAYRLTRRPQPMFAEPVPSATWGHFEPHRFKTRDGEEIGAWLARKGADAPAVLLLHGIGAGRAACLGRAEILGRAGCTVLLISLRAHGDSTGQYNDMGYGARHDVIAAVGFLERSCPDTPIVIHGVSLGAAAALLAARELGHRVQGYILESPFQDLKTAVRNRTENDLPPVLDSIAYHGLLTVAPLVLPDLEKVSPLAAISGIPADVPVLILAGAEDQSARPEEARALHDRIRSHARLIVFERAGHMTFPDTHPARYKQVVLDFVHQVGHSAPEP
jgi:alpha-beta hydrolase superfamily lysophospholipase